MNLCLNPYYLKKQGFYADCGHCLACRLRRRAEWTNRMRHHSSTHQHKGLFVTLTYDNQHLPICNSVCSKQITLFIKRLRQRIKRGGYKFMNGNKVVAHIKVRPTKFTYFLCAEYGGKNHRPHYHIIFFGLDPSYRELIYHTWGKCHRLGYTCRALKGKKAFGYVAGYTNKKLGVGYIAKCEKQNFCAEFQHQSGGIGKEWILQHAKRVGVENCIMLTVDKREILCPRYYRKILGIKYEEIQHLVVSRETKIAEQIQNEHPNEELITPANHRHKVYFCFGNYFVSYLFWQYLRERRVLCNEKLKQTANDWRKGLDNAV